uniref:Spaetzle domain-containing protein n=1 Tax=Tetranychus urticae TaxID=32264 RepID=T1KCY8_TETUR
MIYQDFINVLLVFIIQIVFTLQFNGYSNRNEPATAAMLSSAFEQAGLTFQDLNPTISENLETSYISNNHSPNLHHLLHQSSQSSLTKSPPKSSLFWRLRYPFRSLKETNRALFGRSQSHSTPPLQPNTNVGYHNILTIPKPVKYDNDDEPGYNGILGHYRRPRLSFPAVYGIQSADHDVKSSNSKKLPQLSQQSSIHRPQTHQPPLLSSASSPPTSPLSTTDSSKSQITQEFVRKEKSPAVSIENEYGLNKFDGQLFTEKYNDDKHDKFKSIRYDYSGFKPMGPASSSQLLSSTHPNSINSYEMAPSNGTGDYGKGSNSRDPKYYSLLDKNTNGIDGDIDDLDDEMSENSMETFSSRLSLFHPEKVEPDNKIILPINPTDLLRLVSEETRTKGKPIECANKDLGWCDLGDQYPTEFVESIIRRCQRSVDRMYVEVPANLQDYTDYKPFKPVTSSNKTGEAVNEDSVSTTIQPDSSKEWSIDSDHWTKSAPSHSNILCDSEKKFIRPIIAQDINGSWYLIAQTNLYHQQVPVQICSAPGLSCNGKCSSSSSSTSKSRCVQKKGMSNDEALSIPVKLHLSTNIKQQLNVLLSG